MSKRERPLNGALLIMKELRHKILCWTELWVHLIPASPRKLHFTELCVLTAYLDVIMQCFLVLVRKVWRRKWLIIRSRKHSSAPEGKLKQFIFITCGEWGFTDKLSKSSLCVFKTAMGSYEIRTKFSWPVIINLPNFEWFLCCTGYLMSSGHYKIVQAFYMYLMNIYVTWTKPLSLLSMGGFATSWMSPLNH